MDTARIATGPIDRAETASAAADAGLDGQGEAYEELVEEELLVEEVSIDGMCGVY